MKKSWGALVLVLLCYAAAAGVWAWYLTRRPLRESDFTTLTGTLKSAEEKGSRKSVYLEFYLVESPIRFRVPTDGYRESFNRQAFFANVKPGKKITLTAEKAQLAKPDRPPLDPVDTVFVHGLKDDRMTYSTLDARRKWEERNRLYGLIVAIVLTVAALGLTALYLRAPKKSEAHRQGQAGPADHLSRRYRHLRCNGVTVVSGDDYVMLECPFRPLGGGTFCASCGAFVPLKSVVWDDSGKNVEEYRNRLYYSVPWTRRLYLSLFGTAYEGALNLRLDKQGRPLPPEGGAQGRPRP